MKSTIFGVFALALAAVAGAADPKPTAQPASLNAPAKTEEEVVAEFRKDLMAKRADVMAKGLTLSAEQASKFWPLFETFQQEQDVIVNDQIHATARYAEHLQTLSDKDALDYIGALLERDKKMNELRLKWLTKFQTVLPSRMAARAIQLDRRLGQVTQVQVSSQVPLIR